MIGSLLQPIEGNADSVRGLAASLTSGAAKLSAINAVLVNIKAGSDWDSPAGELFEQSVHESPPLLDALIDRYAGAALALRTFAGELGEAQARAQAAIDWKKAESSVYAALDEQMAARMDAGEPWDDLKQLQDQVLGNMNTADRDHARAWQQFETADRLLARRLRVLAEDLLDDSWHYTAVTKVLSVSQGVASVPAFTRALPILGQVVTAAAAVSSITEIGLLVFYGEGSWKQVGINGAANATGFGAKALKTGALAKAAPISRIVDGKRGYLGESMPTKERFLIGTREELHRKYPKLANTLDPHASPSRLVVPLDNLPTMAPTKGLPVKQQAQIWRAHATAVARRQADKAFFDQWKAVTAGGPNAQRMFVAGTTLEKVVPKARDAANGMVAAKPEEKASRPTYP